jgi:16S rRNA (guanine966-N2)-methyltransferase
MSKYNLRITGGALRGRSLNDKKSLTIRPTSARVREAMFNVLRNTINGAKVLDIYAGTGCLSLEALSRGALFATLIENDDMALRIIKNNLKETELLIHSKIIKGSSPKVLTGLKGSFNLIFADPPYEKNISTEEGSMISKLLANEGLFVYEHRSSYNPPESFGDMRVYDRKVYGESAVSYFSATERL